MIFLLLAGLVTVKSDIIVNDTSPKTSNLISKIRRQLMQDNYDYLPTESDEDFPLNHFDVNKQNSPEKLIDDYDYHEHEKQRFNITDIIVPRAHDYEPKNQTEDNDKVSKNDLLYYMNDDMIGLGNDYEDDGAGAKVKYKVMKVKSAHPNRRSMGVRRFIQERGEDGVALMTLDDEPFPDFKLPRSRRQYMQGSSDNEDLDNLMEDFSLEDY